MEITIKEISLIANLMEEEPTIMLTMKPHIVGNGKMENKMERVLLNLRMGLK